MGPGANLTGATLSGIDLSAIDLSAATLTSITAVDLLACPAALPAGYVCAPQSGTTGFALIGPGT